jgi:hypothetical protein
MKLIPIVGVSVFLLTIIPVQTNAQLTYAGQEKCELETLPLYRVLTVVEQTIKNIHSTTASSQNAHLNALDALAVALTDVNQALALVTSSVSAINNNVLYEYGDICDRFIAMATCAGDFDTTPEPYIIRELRRVIINFDQYLTIFIATRAAFLSPGAKSTLNNMSALNQLLIKQVLNDDHFSWGFLDYLDDYLVSRPLEFIQEHPVFVSSVAFIIVVSIIYCCYERATPEKQEDIKNEQKTEPEKDEKKPDAEKIKKDLEPVFDAIYKEFVEKKLAFMTQGEFTLLVQKKEPVDISRDAQKLLHNIIKKGDIYLPDGTISGQELKNAFDCEVKKLKDNK